MIKVRLPQRLLICEDCSFSNGINLITDIRIPLHAAENS